MNIAYDFHIHSALSPCGNKDMTPCNIVAMATVKGLNAIAVCDHNAIANVNAVMECGDAYGVVVIPGIEVQTSEDIHILALFETYEKLNKFYDKLEFPNIKNRPEIFGEQQIIDTDDNIVGYEERFLLTSASLGIYEVANLIKEYEGLAIPAHIDREANGLLAILGDVPTDLNFSALEFSPRASKELKEKYSKFPHTTSSDAHYLESILGQENTISVASATINNIFCAIKIAT